MSLVIRPVRWWVRTYTSGLDEAVRDRRREEIDSDLREHVAELTDEARTTAVITATVWRRWLGGIVDDLLWRHEQPRASSNAQKAEGRHPMQEFGTARSLAVPLGGVVIAIAAALTVLVIDNIQYMEASQRFVATDTLATISVALFVLGLASLAAGFAVMTARPGPGAVLAAGGSVLAGLMWYWLIVPLVAAGAIAVFAVRRARRIAAAR